MRTIEERIAERVDKQLQDTIKAAAAPLRELLTAASIGYTQVQYTEHGRNYRLVSAAVDESGQTNYPNAYGVLTLIQWALHSALREAELDKAIAEFMASVENKERKK